MGIDAQDGRARHTELRFDRGSRRARIRVDYGPLAGHDVLEPTRLGEWYEDRPRDGKMIRATTYCVQGLATHSGHRRYTVTTTEVLK